MLDQRVVLGDHTFEGGAKGVGTVEAGGDDGEFWSRRHDSSQKDGVRNMRRKSSFSLRGRGEGEEPLALTYLSPFF